MKLLLDTSESRFKSLPESVVSIVAGQMLTPLTQFARWADTFAIDNGAFTMFRAQKFAGLLEREKLAISQCLWVAVPDVVGSARRTREIWQYRHSMVPKGWPLAYVCQDGSEHIGIPWDDCTAVFIGGEDPWKESKYAAQIIKTAKTLGKLVHVGRVNTPARWNHFEALGADTCDGSGAARYDWMLERLANKDYAPLFD